MRGLPFVLIAVPLVLAQSPLEQAVILAREKNYSEARKWIEKAEEPAEPEQRIPFHRLKAAVASGLGENRTAAEEMRLALQLAPRDEKLLLATAVAEFHAGLLDDALQHAESAGNNAATQALAGDIQEARGNYVEAANAYQAAVLLDPGREQYGVALALELVQHQTFEPAIQVLEQAAVVFPKSAKIRTLLGIAYYALGQIEAAETSLIDAIAADSKLQPAYTYLTRIAMESARAPSSRVMEKLCGWDSVVCAVFRWRAARDAKDAALEGKAMEELKRSPADNPLARCELARAYELHDEWAKARADAEACVKLDPSASNHYHLGRIYYRLGLQDLARRQMELRKAETDRLNEQVSRRESAVQAFRYLTK